MLQGKSQFRVSRSFSAPPIPPFLTPQVVAVMADLNFHFSILNSMRFPKALLALCLLLTILYSLSAHAENQQISQEENAAENVGLT